MGNSNEESTIDFSIRFGGENSIDSYELINSLAATAGLVEHISSRVYFNSITKIEVKGTSEGSFVLQLSALIGMMPSLITPDNVGMAKNGLDIFCNLLKMKQHLKRSSPKSVQVGSELVKIENKDCESTSFNINVYNLYDTETDSKIRHLFESNKRDFIEIKSKDETKVKIEKKDFDNMSKPVEILKKEDVKIIKSAFRTTLGIRKPDLIGDTQWELIFNKKIKAYVLDKDFMDKVHDGQISINPRTLLEAQLEYEAHYDNNNKVIKEEYFVTKVFDIIDEKIEQMTI
ncbi:hypothetical protein NBE98_03090 [Clostridium swellfunianum]|uniref:hypothetical protein n=1 Tax=Clostridium swellfunianum TaxID=1367462 RepID=UPI00202E0679|nr:hypothetical protein [Clostridium swellfunianum]MCM0647360.1 hypothetical protein [Clostridium swellfunianum]